VGPRVTSEPAAHGAGDPDLGTEDGHDGGHADRQLVPPALPSAPVRRTLAVG